MQDARYWREQATLCLEMARHVTDQRTADSLRATAGDYFAKATALEARTTSSGQLRTSVSNREEQS